MKRRAFGKTGIEVSEVGFGGWAIGGNEHGNSLGPTDDKASRAAIDAALEAGVTFFDTADAYGHGHSERLLGEAFAASGRRKDLVIATKAGGDFYEAGSYHKHYDGQYLRTALSRSLERLRTDRVDLFQLHDPPADAIKDPAVHEALRKIREGGLARAVGVSYHTLDEAVAALTSDVYDAVQMVHNVGNQWLANQLLPAMHAKGLGVIAREPLAQGWLAGKYKADAQFPQGDIRAGWSPEYRSYMTRTVEGMRAYFHGKWHLPQPLAAIALQFVLAEPAVSTVIASMKTPGQVRDCVGASELPPLSPAQLEWLRE